jgi:uncharacterized protein (DUF433 family)
MVFMESGYYFKKEWDEATGEEATNSWGASIFYFETDFQFNVLRQIQIFENGNVLKYDLEYIDDKFGGLAESPIELDGFNEIAKDQFEQLWEKSIYKRFPEIVCTHDCLWGQPRLEGRRLAVGDIVSLVNIYHEDIGVTMTDFELSLQQIRQALHYCKTLQCKIDKPQKYCHNCYLRFSQNPKATDETDSYQPNWQTAAMLFQKHFT